MECGEVGCNQHTEPDGPEIDPSKVPSKKDERITTKYFYIKLQFSSTFLGKKSIFVQFLNRLRNTL